MLDALAAHDESLRDVVRLVNHPDLGWRAWRGGDAFGRDEVVAALARCVRDGLVEARAFSPESGSVEPLGRGVMPGVPERCRFALTAEGRALHDAWTPPSAPDTPVH